VILWELARASGLVAFAVSTIVVVWGILLAGRALRPAAPQADLHRVLSTLVLLLVAVHVGTLLANPHAHLGVGSLLGLGVSLGVLAGVVTLWLSVLLPLTFRLRQSRRMGYVLWRRLHYLGYAVWGLAFVHGVATGSDGEPWALALYGLASASVAGAMCWRATEGRRAPRARPPAAPRHDGHEAALALRAPVSVDHVL
jgi:sulfoxide reductase heme-binding subunit YedZ